MRTSRVRGRSATILAFALGLLIATAGTATAGRLITGKQIRDGSVTSRDLSKGLRAQLARRAAAGVPGVPGAQGPKGEPGAPGREGPAGAAGADAQGLFAFVAFRAVGGPSVEYGDGVLGVAPTGTAGEYDVRFARPVAGCVAHAAAAIGSPKATGTTVTDLTASAGVIIDPDETAGVKDDVVRAQFYGANGAPRDTSFTIMLSCREG